MTLNVYSINTLTLCFTYTDIGLTGKLEEVKKEKKNSATSCYIVSRHASQISKLQWLWLYIIDETDL